MIKGLNQFAERLDDKFNKLIEKLYGNMKRSFIILLLAQILFNYSAFLSMRWYYQTMVDMTVCASISVEMVNQEKDGKDISWVKDIYKNEVADELVKEVIQAVESKDKERLIGIGKETEKTSNIAALIIAVWLTVVVSANMLIISIFAKKIEVRFGLYKVKGDGKGERESIETV